MPKLSQVRWEAFAKLTAGGAKRADAYLGSGFQVNSKTGKERRKDAQRRATRLLKAHPEIHARIAEIEEELRNNSIKRAAITRDKVLDQLDEVYKKCMQQVPVLNRDGVETGEYTINASAANRATELTGKELGMFADRQLIGSLDAEIENMTVDQVRQLVRASCSEVGLRVVDMSDAQTKEWILANAKRVGLLCTEVPEEPAPPPKPGPPRKPPSLH